jgi:peptidoglycan/LPS O-acetylase OafA/YrhL
MRARVANVDILRALAATMVLAIHAYAIGGRVAPIKAKYWYDVPLIFLASGVWMFFVISGYVITRPFVTRLIEGGPLPALWPYTLRRSFRIYPLYWIAVTAIIAIDGTAGARPWQLVVHYALLNNLVPGRQEALFAPAWTLTLEVLFYASVPLLAAAVRRYAGGTIRAERLAAIVVASWAASIAFMLVADLPGDGKVGLWLRFVFPGMWQAFCPGILLAIAPHLTDSRWRRWLVEFPATRAAAALAVVSLAAAAILSSDAPLRFGVVPYQLIGDVSRPLFSLGYVVAVAAALRSRPWTSRGGVVIELGLASYGLYLIHPVIEAFMLKHGIAPVDDDTVFGYAVNLICLLAVTAPVALASWRWLERPAIRAARRAGSRPGKLL